MFYYSWLRGINRAGSERVELGASSVTKGMSGLGAYPGFAVGERDVSGRRVTIWQADVEPSVV